ncbi:NHL repeat containing protein [Candidatus Magnetomorum sp. HK-1]|nr:NHL repeat containing protein [Candidatus Magnetomorum sp. HK-1]
MKKSGIWCFSWIALTWCIFYTNTLQAELLIARNQNGNIGEEITISIAVSNAANSLLAFGFDIVYDPSVLEFVRCTPGPLIMGYSFYKASSVDKDRIRIGAIEPNSSRYIQKAQSGDLFYLKFEVLDSNKSEIEILSLKDGVTNWQTQNGQFTPLDQSTSQNIYYRFKRLWPALKQAWYFYHPMDIAVDTQRFVYVADTWNDRIQKFSTSGQAVTKWGSNGTSDGMFQTPISIGVYQNANQTYVFVVDQLNHRIQKFTGNGEFVCKWGSQGENKGQFQMPSGIAIDHKGAVYVADTGNNRIQKFSTDGIYQQEWTSTRNAQGKMLAPYDLSIDKSNNLYVTDIETHCVIKFSDNGQLLDLFDSWGPDFENYFYKPTGIVVAQLDGYEILIVSDSGNDRVLTFLPNGVPLREHEYITNKLSLNFNAPSGIATDNSGKIFIADTLNNRIVQIQIRPEISVNQWASQGIQNGYFIRPRGIFFQNDRLFVSSGASYDSLSHHFIQSFSPEGDFIQKWSKASHNEDHFNEPSGIVANDKYYYVLDSGNHRVLQYFLDGTFFQEWGRRGVGPGEMESPTGLALFQEYVIVADTGNHRIQIFDNNGYYIDEWGQIGSEIGDFLIPKDLAVDSAGNIYVADTGNHRIQKFSEYGEFISQWGGFGSLNGELNSPSGIAVQADNSNIVVADTGNHRCQVFSQYGKYIAKFGEYGSFAGQFNGPFQLTIDPDNNIYVTDQINNRVQKFQPITMGDGKSKAIILVGDDTYGDALFQTNANLAYRALNYQGFGKNDIYYLSKDTDLDLDDNGMADDIDALATNDNLKNAVLEWANDAEHLIVYLIGHNDLYFRTNATEVLTNSDLDKWMDQLQTQTQCRITFIFDACKSGNYLSTYAAPDSYSRVVITSTGLDENAYLIGAISFSNYFWTHIFNGLSVQHAFNLAATTTAQINQPPYMATPQNPLMDADSNSIGNELTDYNLTENLYFGNATDAQEETIKITKVSDPQTLTQGTSATLMAQVISEKNPIKNVWAVIRRPDYQSGASDTIDIQLSFVKDNQFEAVYQGFETPGTYLIAFYAEDENGNTGIPQFSTVSFDSPMYRRAVIIVGEASDTIHTTFFEQTASSIYDALIFQGYTDETIYISSPTVFTQAWDSGASLNSVKYALGQWTQTPENENATQDILICFLGLTEQNQFILNSNEMISSEALNTQISHLENQIPGKILVVCDAPNAWGFLSQSAQSASNRRILIAGSSASESALFVSENNISFSEFFWQRIFNGFDVKESFRAAKDALNILNQYQSPCLEADGDGEVNQYNDYAEAREFTIGYGIMLAQDTVSIASVMPPSELSGETNALIWAQKITSTSTIDRVWAIIIPPNLNYSEGSVIDHLPQIELIYNKSTDRYEAEYTGFDLFGEYRIAIYASSTNGITADPAKTSLYQNNMPDSFESSLDNEIHYSKTISINDTEAQRHNFHEAADKDWVKFYAIAGNIYRIFANNIDLNCDPVIELYDKDAKTILVSANDGIGNELEEIIWVCQADGIYYVNVKNYDSESYGKDTGYDLRINSSATIFNGLINGYVRSKNTNIPIGNALIKTSKNLTDISLLTGTYRIGGHESGEAQIFAEASGFLPYSASIYVDPISITQHDIIMIPSVLPGDINADGFIRLDDAISAAQVITGIEIVPQHLFAADVTNNGRIGIEEMIYIMVECSD